MDAKCRIGTPRPLLVQAQRKGATGTLIKNGTSPVPITVAARTEVKGGLVSLLLFPGWFTWPTAHATASDDKNAGDAETGAEQVFHAWHPWIVGCV